MANTFGKTIPHYEDFIKTKKAEEFLSYINTNNLSFKHKVYYVEKFDGLFLDIGVKETGAFFIRTKTFEFTEPEQINTDILVFKEIKDLFIKLEPVFVKLFKNIPIVLHGEYIPCHDHNIIEYDKEEIGKGLFVLFSCESINEEYNNKPSTAGIALNKEFGEEFTFFTPARNYINHTTDFSTLYNSSSELGAKRIEGVVVYFDDKPLFKVVDKTFFTEELKNQWKCIGEISKLFNSFKKEMHQPFNDDIKLLIDDYEYKINEFKKHSNYLDLLPRKQLETTYYFNAQMSLISRLRQSINDVGSDETKKRFINRYFLQPPNYRPNIGHAIKGTNSLLKNENAIPSLYQLCLILDKSRELFNKLKIVGNKNKHLLSDIDVAVDKEVIQKLINNQKDELFWEDVTTWLMSTGVSFTINKGLQQFHVLIPAYNKDSTKQMVIDPITKEYIAEEQAMIQVDFLVGDILWMEDILSAPKKSKYKAITRNLFLKALCAAKNITNEQGSFEYSLNFRDGLWVKTYDLKQPTGRQKKVQKELVHKMRMFCFLETVNMFLFDKGEPWIPNKSFEGAFELFEKYYEDSLKQKAVLIFKDLCKENHIDLPEEVFNYLPKETKQKVVALFPGSFKPFHNGHYQIIKQLADEADEVKVLVSIQDREDFSGLRAYWYIQNWNIPFMPNNVKFEYTCNPILYAHKLIHEHNKLNDKVLLFVDKREYQIKESDLFEYRTSERLLGCSGTAFRAAIRSGNEEDIKKYLISRNGFLPPFWKDQIKSLLSSSVPEKFKKEYSLLVENLTKFNKVKDGNKQQEC